MTTAVIIQARMGSSRLRGKVLEDLAGQTVLAHVIERARRIPGVDVVCCAVPDEAGSDPVAAEALKQGARVHRGSEHDVLSRYEGAARACDASTVIRITSDCPLIDPVASGRVLSHLTASKADYCSNLEPRSWPKGLDTEAFTAAVLHRAAATATEAVEREHVTPWIRQNRSLAHANVEYEKGDFHAYRWTLDYPEDLAFFRALYAILPPPPHITPFEDILRVVHEHPEIVALNAHLK
jgi:spore coat polysaccharide biosynthesis protein SpsF (cytidylyltransferase family)